MNESDENDELIEARLNVDGDSRSMKVMRTVDGVQVTIDINFDPSVAASVDHHVGETARMLLDLFRTAAKL